MIIVIWGRFKNVEADYIGTVKGIINKLKFRIPKHLIAGFDGRTLYFGITKAQAKRYLMDKTIRFSS